MRTQIQTALALVTATFLAGCATGSAMRTRTSVPSAPVSTGSNSATLIPSGTTMVIRTNEPISARTASEAGQYVAEVAQDVVNAQGQTIIPKGAPAKLTIIEASTGGVAGTSQLELALSSLSVGGRTYTVESEVTERTGRAGLGANERTAKTVGGGAALGALIGAIAGGGTGAVAGAAIGAAGGAAVQVLTRGDVVRVPAESVLTFKLERPIRSK